MTVQHIQGNGLIVSNKLWFLVGEEGKYENLISDRLIRIKKDYEADVSSVSPSSERRAARSKFLKSFYSYEVQIIGLRLVNLFHIFVYDVRR